MVNMIFSPITLAIIGLTLVTLAASNATENEHERTEQMLQELIKQDAPQQQEASEAKPSDETPSAEEKIDTKKVS
jgi:hypothetical protein